jgi:hypothetical protein
MKMPHTHTIGKPTILAMTFLYKKGVNNLLQYITPNLQEMHVVQNTKPYTLNQPFSHGFSTEERG